MQTSMKAATFLIFTSVSISLVSPTTPTKGADDKAKEEEAAKIGVEAYIYGYPLVTMEMTRRVTTNVASLEGMRGPMGQFINAREYPTAAFRDVTAPNG